jgi:hypothetical protein
MQGSIVIMPKNCEFEALCSDFCSSHFTFIWLTAVSDLENRSVLKATVGGHVNKTVLLHRPGYRGIRKRSRAH